MTTRPSPRFLLPALIFFLIASLLHFIHNAEFLREYPGIPASWAKSGVYAVWLAIAAVGVGGYGLVRAGWLKTGLALMACAAAGGMDSLGHYLLAPFAAHSGMMNATILIDVGSAFVLMAVIVKCAINALRSRAA